MKEFLLFLCPILVWFPFANGYQAFLETTMNSKINSQDGFLTPKGKVSVVTAAGIVDGQFKVDSASFIVEDELQYVDFRVSSGVVLSATADGSILNVAVENRGMDRYRINFTCLSSIPVKSLVNIKVSSTGEADTSFAFKKECLGTQPFLKDLLIYTDESNPVVVKGLPTAEFNIFDYSGTTKVVDSRTSYSKFLLTTFEKQYWLGTPYVLSRSLSNPDEALKELGKGRPFLNSLMNDNTADELATFSPIPVERDDSKPKLLTTISGDVSGENGRAFLFNLKSELETFYRLDHSFDALTGGQVLGIQYHCTTNGVHVVQLVVPIDLEGKVVVNDANGKRVNEREVRMSWIKICKVGEFQVKEGGDDKTSKTVSLAGLQINLATKVDGMDSFYPVLNGLPTSWFAKGNSIMKTSMEESRTQFFVSLDPVVVAADESERTQLFLTGVRAYLSEKSSEIASCPGAINEYGHCSIPVLNIDLEDDTALQHQVDVSPIPIDVEYHCIRPGRSQVVLEVHFGLAPHQSDHTIVFSWDKICESAPISALDIKLTNPNWFTPLGALYEREEERDSNIEPTWSKQYPYEDVVAFTQGSQSTAFTEHSQKRNSFDLPASESVMVFRITASKFYPGTQVLIKSPIRFSSPKIQSSGTSCTANAYFLNSNNTQFAASAMDHVEVASYDNSIRGREVKFGAPIFVKVVHKCSVGGSAKLELAIPVVGGEVIQLFWNKECGWIETHGVSVKMAGTVSFVSFLTALGLMAVFLLRLNRKHRRLIAHAKYHKVPLDEFDDVLDGQDENENLVRRVRRNQDMDNI